MLAAVKDEGRMDIIADLSNQLPATVIAELLGVPGSDQRQFKQWSDDIASALSGIDTGGTQEELFALL